MDYDRVIFLFISIFQFLGVYCLQYDDEKIVSGLRDNTIKVINYR